MLKWKELGSYLGRRVEYASKKLLLKSDLNEKFSDSIVAIYFNNGKNTAYKDLRYFFSNLISSEPLSVFIAGKDSKKCFDYLIEYLSEYKSEYHIMTNFSDENEWFESFFYATYPDEKMFDYWKYYKIIEISGDKISKIITNFINK
jgi:hypothetical protein